MKKMIIAIAILIGASIVQAGDQVVPVVGNRQDRIIEELQDNMNRIANSNGTIVVSSLTASTGTIASIVSSGTVTGSVVNAGTSISAGTTLKVGTSATVGTTLGVTGLISANNITVATNANIAVLNLTGTKGTAGAVAGLITNGVTSMTADATWLPIQHGGTNYWIPAFLKN